MLKKLKILNLDHNAVSDVPSAVRAYLNCGFPAPCSLSAERHHQHGLIYRRTGSESSWGGGNWGLSNLCGLDPLL